MHFRTLRMGILKESWREATVLFFVLYSFVFLLLLILYFKNDHISRATILMSLGLFLIWVCMGGLAQLVYLKRNYTSLTLSRKCPVLLFTCFATILSLAEEATATFMTNLVIQFGGTVGQSFITASNNFFHVIFFHSVVIFIPMFFTLGVILKKYDIPPFKAALLFGCVGTIGEFTLSGSAIFINTPFWVLIYGLMVYLPAHFFVRAERKKVRFLFYFIFIISITLSAVSTFWFPVLIDNNQSRHFVH